MSIMGTILRNLTYQGVPIWRNVFVVQLVLQVLTGLLVVVLISWFFVNIGNAIHDRDIPYGFSFLSREYQTPIGQHFLGYESSDTFLYAFIVAATNTVIVSVMGIILATMLGILVGISSISTNWIMRKIALVYIEVFRNIPLLVHLFFWFYVVLELPPIREGYILAQRVYINNGGLSFPWLTPNSYSLALTWVSLVTVIFVFCFSINRWLAGRLVRRNYLSHPILLGLLTSLIIGTLSWVIMSVVNGEPPFLVSVPEPQGAFGRIEGGLTLPGGLVALLIGLVTYTAAFIAEIVRAGIQSVAKGQIEASRAVGLSAASTLRNVTLPQALRVIVPPLISQYLNLTKNSSLAGAIGYSDLTNVAKTMTQTAPAVSIFILIMATYLAMSLTYSVIGNLYNRHIRFTGG